MKVLVVDDSIEARELLAALLDECGHEVIFAENGQKALETLGKEIVDLVISDILMPVMDGFTLCTRIKADKDLQKIPFIFCTATYTDDKDENLALKLGADHVIRKPFNLNRFMTVIQAAEKKITQNDSDTKFVYGTEKEVLQLYNERLIQKLEKKTIELKQGEKALKESEQKYRRHFEILSDVIYSYDTDFRILSVTPSVKRILGYSPEELIGKVFIDLNILAPQSLESAINDALTVLSGKSIVSAEYQFIAKDGSLKFGEISGEPIIQEGKVIEVICVARDITERKQAELRLLEEMRFSESAINSLPGLFYLFNEKGRFLRWNKNMETLSDYSSEEISRMSPLDLFDEKEKASVAAAIEEVFVKGESFVEANLISKHGQRTPYFFTGKMFVSGGQKILIGMGIDITKRKKTEENLLETNIQLEQALAYLKTVQQRVIQQERLRALGQMASGIAHDLNNALSVVVGYSDFLLLNPDELKDTERTRQYLKIIDTAAKDTAKVVGRLREFYRKRDENEVFLPVQLNEIARQAIELTQPKWKDQALAEGVSIRIDTDLRKIPPISANQSELREALTNLMLNAVDAMPNGGVITILTRTEESRDFGQGLGLHMEDDISALSNIETVALAFTDTGVGMTEEVKQKCLDPFFSTKGERGTGLGLSMVYGTMIRHSGTIDIDSQPGKGTTFTLRFPVYKTPQFKVDLKPEKKLDQRLHILVVDDEKQILELLKRFLERDGHFVETAVNGLEGLEKFKSGQYDLVVTDRSMPVMSGDQLSDAVKALSPCTPIIMTTGFGDIMKARNEKPKGIDHIICKPITLGELREALLSVMGGKREA